VDLDRGGADVAALVGDGQLDHVDAAVAVADPVGAQVVPPRDRIAPLVSLSSNGG